MSLSTRSLAALPFHLRNCPMTTYSFCITMPSGCDIGGGEYARTLSIARWRGSIASAPERTLTIIDAAIEQWRNDSGPHAVIELVDNGVYEEQINIQIGEGKYWKSAPPTGCVR